jgi:hypothetical protein
MNWPTGKFVVCAPKWNTALLRRNGALLNTLRSSLLAHLVAATGVLLSFAPGARAQLHDEHAVKVAFVFNLTKYVEWPQTNNQISIGVVGDGGMGELLKSMLEGKTSESRSIHVVLSPSEAEIEHCSLIYIADPSPKRIHAVLNQVRGKSILTVGDSDTFVRQGGMVALVTVGQQVQIQIGLETAQQSRLKISSRLLNIATLVTPEPEAKN